MTLRLAVLGCGRQARLAVGRALRDTDAVVVTRVLSREPARAAAFIREYELTSAVVAGTAEEVFGSGVDAVYIGLPNRLHEEWTLGAVEAGKSALVEKPLAPDLAPALHIASQAASRGVAVLEGVMIQHHPWASRLAELCAGLSGVRALRTELSFSIPAERRLGNVLDDVAPYWLWLVSLVTPLASTKVVSVRLGRDDVEVRLSLGHGAVAELQASHARPYRATHSIEHDGGSLQLPDIFRANLGPQRLAIDVFMPSGGAREWLTGNSVFTHQLVAFAALCSGDAEARARAMQASLSRLRVLEAIRACALDGALPSR